MGIDEGTLHGYDLVIAISQEAIDKQLEKLYLTEVSNPVEGGPKFLIDHELHLHKKFTTDDGQLLTAKTGLDAFVYCPKIDLCGDSTKPNHNVAKVKFKFRRAEPGEVTEREKLAGKSEDSILTYEVITGYDEEGRTKYDRKYLVVNDWEISWEATVTKEEIVDVLKDIVAASDSPKSPVEIAKPLKEELGKYVDSKVFRVSSIFCAFESAQIASSLKIVDHEGKERKDLNMLDQFVQEINTRFAMATAQPGPKGVSVPNNPFVLGYTIKQTEVAPAQTGVHRPVYFTPSDFRCTLSKRHDKCKGTLNFCLLTHRENKPPKFDTHDSGRQFNYEVDTPGRFDPNLFGQTGITASPGSADGILSFCQDIFVNYWIGHEIAPKFKITPKQMAQTVEKSLMKDAREAYKNSKYKLGSDPAWIYHNETVDLSRDRTYRWSSSAKSKKIQVKRNVKEMPLEAANLIVSSSVEVTYKSSSGEQSQNGAAQDAKHRLDFEITSVTKVKLDAFRKKFLVIKADFDDDSDWESAYESVHWISLKYKFTVGTDNANIGGFSTLNRSAEHMDANGNLKSFDRAPDDQDHPAPGAWKSHGTHGWVSLWDWSGLWDNEISRLVTAGDLVTKEVAAQTTNAMNGIVDSLKSTVILPAGDVFMFKGLTSFGPGHVATVVNYNTVEGGDVVRHDGQNLGFEGWKKPVPAVTK